MSRKPSLSPLQVSAARMLADGVSVRETAEAIGSRPATIYGWANDPRTGPVFGMLADRRHRARLDELGDKALGVLDAILDEPNVFARLQAAQSLLGEARHMRTARSADAGLSGELGTGLVVLPLKGGDWMAAARAAAMSGATGATPDNSDYLEQVLAESEGHDDQADDLDRRNATDA